MNARIVGLLGVMLLAATAPAHADPIVVSVSNGTIEVGQTTATFHLIEPGILDVTGTLRIPTGYQNYNWPRLDGQALPFVTTLTGPTTGAGTVAGTFYPSFVIGFKLIQITSSFFALPASGSGKASFSAPAAVTDFLDFFAPGTPTTQLAFSQPFFVASLRSAGSLTGIAAAAPVTVNGESRTEWSFENAVFDFGSATATPEPATILLFGLGAVGALVARRRRGVDESSRG